MTSGITRGSVLRYVFTPQIGPRLRDLFGTGFTRLAYLMAQVYRAVNILPANHEVLRPENRDAISLRGVMAAAASEIEFTRANTDKIIIYVSILVGLVLLAAQLMLTAAYLMVNPAFAQMPDNFGDFFHDPNYEEDIAYNLLFAVFGVPELFTDGGARNSYHIALHALLQFYSIGLLVVGAIIICYFIFAVLAETAQSGTPFGRRFNHVWVPLRLVMALGLLIPIGHGLNAAQWITLYAAKYGSDFASEGWYRFNDAMTGAFLRNQAERIGTPQAPDLVPLARFMMTVNACAFAYNSFYDDADKVQAYVVRSSGSGGGADHRLMENTTFPTAYNFSGRGDIIITFGEFNQNLHDKELGRVFPYCGRVIVHAGDSTDGGLLMQGFYWRLIRLMSATRYGAGGDPDPYDLAQYAESIVRRYTTWDGVRCDIPQPGDPGDCPPLPPPTYRATLAVELDSYVRAAIDGAVGRQAASGAWARDLQWMEELGWGGAGVWYNKIAQINGSLVTAVQNVPSIKQWPAVMEAIKSEKLKENSETLEPFRILMSNNLQMAFRSEAERAVAESITQVENWWNTGDARQDPDASQTRVTGNMFIDAINLIFGTRGLFNMCANTDTHPLAQLSLLGKGLVEASIRNIGLAAGAGALSMMNASFVGKLAQMGSSILLSVATVTISMGFMLFYVLPFMPFLYFFFAVGGWIKGLFEAMIGVPLWALAHLRIDGEGLPGDAAMDGYYLIFEIFLRPILIIFGLLASVVIFSAMVKVLNDIFYLVVSNLSGHDGTFTQFCAGMAGGGGGGGGGGNTISFFRGPIDELFFTIIYAIIVYMIGMSCFKLIDLVPNNLLRYMGKSVKTFNDMANDPAEGLMMRLSIGSSQVSGTLVGIGQNAGAAASGAVRGVAQMAGPSTPPAQNSGG